MAVSKSYSQNRPFETGYSGVKGYFSILGKNKSTWSFNFSGHLAEEVKPIPLGGLDKFLYHAATCEKAYRLKAKYNSEASAKLLDHAEQLLEAGNTRLAIAQLEKALLLDPENSAARYSYARISEASGKQREALMQYRLALETTKFHKQPVKKQLFYKNPLNYDYSINWHFEPSFAKTTKPSGGRFFSRILKPARAACLAAILSFAAFPAGSMTPGNPESPGEATLNAFIVDENNQAWNETLKATLYRGAINPDSIISSGTVDEFGELSLKNITTHINANPYQTINIQTYPTVFDQKVIVAFQLKEKADITINLYNTERRKIWSKQLQGEYPGLIEEEIPGQRLADGAYIAEVVVEKDGETQRGTNKIIKRAGAQTGYKTGMSLTTKGAQIATGRHILVLDGDFAEETIIEGIALPSGQTVELGTVEVEIDPTVVSGTVKDQYGENWDAPHKGAVYEGSEKLGEAEIADGELQVPVYIKKPTDLEIKLFGEYMTDTAKIEKMVNIAGENDIGEIIVNSNRIRVKSGGNGFYDLDTKWLNDSTRQKPTGIAGMKVLVRTAEGEYETETDAEGQFEMMIVKPANDTIEAHIFHDTDTTWYYWGRKDIVIENGKAIVTAKNDTTGIPAIRRQWVEGSDHPESKKHEGMDFLEYMKERLQLYYLWGDHAEEFVRVPDDKLPVTYCPDSSYINRGLYGIEVRAAPNEEYPKAANLGVKALESGRLKFKKVDNTQDAFLKFYYYSNLAGQTDIGMNLVTREYLEAVIKLRGPPEGEMISGEAGAYIIAHEGMQALTLSGDYSPYIEDNFYHSGIVRSSANPTVPLESHTREKKMIKTVYDLENFFRLNDYHKNNPID